MQNNENINPGQGVLEYLPEEQNLLLSVLFMLSRLMHGYLNFFCCKAMVLCCRTWFPDHVNLTVGLEMSANFLGGGISIFAGGYLYDAFGFKEPFYAVGAVCALGWLYNCLVMPATSDPIISSSA